MEGGSPSADAFGAYREVREVYEYKPQSGDSPDPARDRTCDSSSGCGDSRTVSLHADPGDCIPGGERFGVPGELRQELLLLPARETYD
jgi:hypothetical protein